MRTSLWKLPGSVEDAQDGDLRREMKIREKLGRDQEISAAESLENENRRLNHDGRTGEGLAYKHS